MLTGSSMVARDARAGTPRYEVQWRSWLPSPHKGFGRSGDVPQQFRRGLQIPIRGIDVDVPHVGRQG